MGLSFAEMKGEIFKENLFFKSMPQIFIHWSVLALFQVFRPFLFGHVSYRNTVLLRADLHGTILLHATTAYDRPTT